MKKNIAAGIVLFNPEESNRLEMCIKSALKQFDKIYVFDNSTTSIGFSFDNYPNVKYISECENKGIAYALNRLMEAAESDNYKWLVTIDQDSVLPDHMVDTYASHIQESELAIICSQVIDYRRTYMIPKLEPAEEYVDFCITSGSCTSIEVWKKIGRFDEKLFIDLVDNEFCKRVELSGYKILKINSIILNQEFGKIVPKSQRIQKFWIRISKVLRNENFAKFAYKKYVSPLRVYYTNRNILYLKKKYAKYGPVGYENYNCKSYMGFWISFNFPSLLRAQDKVAVYKAIKDGVREGKVMAKKVGEL